MAPRTTRFTAYVYCSECSTEAHVRYTHTWDDPIVQRMAIAKAGWRQIAGTHRHICAKCAEGRDQ